MNQPLNYKVLILLSYSVRCISDLQSQSIDPAFISGVAETGFATYLEKVPVGKEVNYGFNSRADFKKVKTGMAYPVMVLYPEINKTDASVSVEESQIVPANQWRVNLTVDGHNKCFVTVAKMNETWKVVGLGATGLAREIEELRVKQSLDNRMLAILKIPLLNCDFIIVYNDDHLKITKIYALNSSKLALGGNSNFNVTGTLTETLEIVKETIQTGLIEK